jgi:predicted transcriptional regulator
MMPRKTMTLDAKKTMTLNLSEAEMRVLDELANKKDLSKTAVLRQALRLYQMVEARLSAGEKLVFEDEKAQKKAGANGSYEHHPCSDLRRQDGRWWTPSFTPSWYQRC